MSETKDLLIEIGTEELPPKALKNLSRAFEQARGAEVLREATHILLKPNLVTSSPPPVENWPGEAPLVEHPYGYGIPPGQLDVGVTTGEQLWTGARR